MAIENPKIPSNLLHALTNIQPSQLMDTSLWDFKNLKTVAAPGTEGLLDFALETEESYPLEPKPTSASCQSASDLF